MVTDFRITGGRGFHLKFPNGVTLSTQFGWGNLCDNYDLDAGRRRDVFQFMRDHDIGCDTCEIMMWTNANGGKTITEEWSKNESGVQGYVTMKQWLSAVDFARNYKVEKLGE